MRGLGSRRLHLVALGLIVLIAVALRLWGIGWGLYDADVSRRAHPDEWAVFWLFRWFDNTHSLNTCPSPGSRCFFDWGPLYPYLAYGMRFLVAPVVNHLPAATFGPHADVAYVKAVIAGRITSATASVLTVLVIYRLGAAAYSRLVGLAAATILTLSALVIQLDHFATPDSTLILFVSTALLAMHFASSNPSAGRFAAAGALVGISASTQNTMWLLALPLIAAWLTAPGRRRRWLLLALGCAASVWLVVDIYALANLGAFLSAELHGVLMRTVDSSAAYQGRFAQYGPGLLYVVRYPLGYGVGFAISAWLIAGVAAAIARHRTIDVILLSWLVPYFAVVTISPAKFMRYSAPLLPVLAVFGGVIVVDVLSAPARRVRLLAAVCAIGSVVYSSAYDVAYAGLFSTADPRSVAAGWITKHVPRNAKIEFEQLPNGLVNLPYFVSAERYNPCFAQFRVSALSGPVNYVAVDNYSLEDHARVDQHVVQRFRTAISEDSNYTVAFQVKQEPSILGLAFSIAGSPHDWRYPTHEITIYRHATESAAPDPYCFPSVSTAVAALYPPLARQSG